MEPDTDSQNANGSFIFLVFEHDDSYIFSLDICNVLQVYKYLCV